MPVTGFNHFNLRARRPLLEDLRDFYIDVIGMQPGLRPPLKSYGYWLYVGPHALLHLSEAAPDEDRSADVSSTFDHVALTCTGMAEFELRLRTHGVEYTRQHVAPTGQHQVFLRDPAGNGVELNFSARDA